MFRKLTGKIIDKDFTSFVIDCGGVGYFVKSNPENLDKVGLDQESSFWIHTSVRENAIDLYGFSKKEELDFFELLLTISGIGPKSALSIMATSNLKTLQEGISSGDALYLSKTSGLGKKTAEKIVLGLKDKIGLGVSGDKNSFGNHVSTAIDALISLGYSIKDAREAVTKIDEKDGVEKIIKEALRKLN